MRYSFNDEKSLIREIEVFTPDKESQAIIFTPENISIDEIAKIKQNMEQNGYKVIAGEHKNQAVLKVYGFDSANNLLATMANDGAVFGVFQTSKTELDEHKKDKNDNSKLALLGAGACFTIASSAILAAGAIRKSAGETFQGVAGIVPAIGLMWASQQSAESQMSYLYKDLREFAESNNLRMNNDVRAVIAEKEAPDDLFHNFQRGVFEKGPAFNNAVKAIAISSGTLGAFQQGNVWKTAGNALAVTGLLAANAIPEQHSEHQSSVLLGGEIGGSGGKKAGEVSEPPSPPKGFVGQMVATVQASPQMLAGGLAVLQQGFKAVGNELHDKPKKIEDKKEYDKQKPIYEAGLKDAYHNVNNADGSINETYSEKAKDFTQKLKELEEHRAHSEQYAKAVVYDRISMVGYGIGYALYTQTKLHNGSKLELDSVIEVCANIVNDHPQERRKAAIQRLATFLGNHPYVHENVDELVSQINHKMAVLAQSPWAGHEKANNIVKFAHATRLDGATQEQVEMAWKGEKPNYNVMEATKQSLEKLVTNELQPSAPAM